jgi:flagellar biosynthesis/type III secretory pathway protein FliH
VDPAALLGLVKAALDQLDLRETHRLRMHPQDAPAIEQRLRALGIPQRLEVVGDPALERGAAVFETSRGEMDASVDTQLAEISRGLTDLVERHR